jgi:phosphate starvation-inducible protein PhoH and related proteins
MSEHHLQFEDNELAQKLYGPQNEYLKIIEEALKVNLHVRGAELKIDGDQHNGRLAFDILNQLYNLLKKNIPVYKEDVNQAIRILSSNGNTDLKQVFEEAVRIPGRKKPIVPRSQNQRTYLEAMRDNDLVFAIGPAGTGKTYLAIAMAVDYFLSKKVSRIILARPAVEAGEKLGFLPGDIAEKINPYLRPLYDALYDMIDFERVSNFLESGVIEIAPLAFMRGRTLSSSFIILDEAQNCSPDQMKMMLTRIGPGSKAVVAGDTTQIDLPREQGSGLIDVEGRLKKIPGIAFQYFSENDVVRHNLVSKIIEAYKHSV